MCAGRAPGPRGSTVTPSAGGRLPVPAVLGTPRRTGRRPAANPPPPVPFADFERPAAPIRRVPRRTAAPLHGCERERIGHHAEAHLAGGGRAGRGGGPGLGG